MTVRPDRAVRVLWWAFCAVFGLGGLLAAVLVVAGVADGRWGGAGVAAGAAVGLGLLAALMASLAHRPGAALVLEVGPEALVFSRAGRTDVVARGQVGLVVLRGASRAGLVAFDVFGLDRALVGRWDTNWMKTPTRAIRALHRLGWPWVFHDPLTPGGGGRLRSENAPAWANEVL